MSVYDNLTTTNRRQFSRATGAAPLVGEHRAAPALNEFARLFDPAPWRTHAACKGMPTEWWYPERGDIAPKAKAICAECPVQDDCGTYAVNSDERFGIWAGVSIDQHRRAERREGNTTPPATRARMVSRNATGPRPHTWAPIVHGTRSGYKAEQRRGLDVCADCKAAWNAYKQQLKDRKAAA